MIRRATLALLVGLVGLAFSLGNASAEALGMPRQWEMGFQPAFSPVAEKIHEFHNMLLVIICGIVLLVLGILAFIVIKFNAKNNPVPSKTTHNTLLEVVWTAVPIIILVVIAIPSLKLLVFQDRAQSPEMTLKVTGRQWYWHYTYPDHGGFSFDSIPIQDSDLEAGQPRLLAVDNPVVVPVGAAIRVLMNSDDVIHNWAVPSLGLKRDATPGRVNETWFQANQEGTYYGMCSELCGVNHYFMPIQVVAVSREKFDAWVKDAQQKFVRSEAPAIDVAAKESTLPPSTN